MAEGVMVEVDMALEEEVMVLMVVVTERPR